MRFPYYARLSKAEQAVYRKSDALVAVPLPRPAELRPLIFDIERALLADDKRAVQRATRSLVDAMIEQLGAPRVVVKVLAVRPGDDDGELHGLYEAEDGRVPELKVWMRTHARKKPVAKKSFVRTVVHEVCHHLDYFVFDLDPSLHTEGFFKRESHLSRQLLVDPAGRLGLAPPPTTPAAPVTTKGAALEAREQLAFRF